ncbi:heat shock protein 27-like [Condylostylus longicornis]|uniref:heat shock protein 27-like n=1 Tax=Condylostylus longicornis TaxID=2530218 RepID=UPI00244E5883|nr:heat shock protein 27-like [Condylostylus longicornis]
MSLIPFLLSNSYDLVDPWELRRHYSGRHRQISPWDHFGLGITPAEIQLLSAIPSLLTNETDGLTKKLESNLPQPVVGKDGFQVHMDVQQFKPNEITVKTVDDYIVIEGKHEDRQDEHGYISRHFVRKYKLPKGYNSQQVVSSLSSDGVLTIKAPLPKSIENSNERVVQIQQTGPAHLSVKENKPEEK